MKKILFALVAIMCQLGLSAQQQMPISIDASVDMTSETEGVITINAKIENGWHIYGLAPLPEGVIGKPTDVKIGDVEGFILDGELMPSRAEDVDGEWTSDVTFTQKFRLTDARARELSIKVSGQVCSSQCILFNEKLKLTVGNASLGVVGEQSASDEASNPIAATTNGENSWWSPVEVPVATDGAAAQATTSAPWWQIFIWGFLGGLAALLTPCVWPMIPLTVSFFLKKNKSKAKSIRDAVTYGLSIIVIYLALGLIITFAFGAGALNDLATNAVFNLIFFAMLVLFGISFLGAFDIKLPSKWSNSIDNKAENTTGLLSIFFMAFTLALVSFSCTGPLIGTLLVEAASIGNVSGPAVGMGGFALALALPFTLFAIFPSMLKEMPRSGGWLNSVKVVLGFLELALSLKFLSVADLAYGWGILDREVFVALWVVIFVLLGMYLLGKLKFSHDSDLDHVSIPRFFLALTSLSFAVYLLPGLWGAPLKAASAFVPPLSTQDFNLYGGTFQEFDDYEEGMRYAKEHNMPVLIDFSGHGCVNCREMEGAVLDTEEVRQLIQDNYVMIKLMVDERKPLTKPYTVTENGKEIDIETVGDKWKYLQSHKFGAIAQPYYIVLDNEGNPLTPYREANYDVDAFAQWLELGIENYNNPQATQK